MLKVGYAIVYEAEAEFGDNEDWYRKLESRAKLLRKGVWSLVKFNNSWRIQTNTLCFSRDVKSWIRYSI